MAWYKRIWADLALRSAGLALLCVAAVIVRALFGSGARAAVPLDYLLAAIGFLSASSGGALSWQGRHLFDEVALSARWTAHKLARG